MLDIPGGSLAAPTAPDHARSCGCSECENLARAYADADRRPGAPLRQSADGTSLVEAGVKPYYLHHPDLAPGTRADRRR
jgi:hypothetical protein